MKRDREKDAELVQVKWQREKKLISYHDSIHWHSIK